MRQQIHTVEDTRTVTPYEHHASSLKAWLDRHSFRDS